MKKWWKESALRQQENGMEAIEGLLVITLMLFVLFYICLLYTSPSPRDTR